MSDSRLRFVFCGLSITSSWGNGHATTYRGLIRELHQRGHEILFLERDVPWYRDNRDLPKPPGCRTRLYSSLDELKETHTREIREADVVVVGSYVQDGVAVGEWVNDTARGITAFYDIDTPVTLAKLRQRDEEYLSASLIQRYQLYLSFTGGPTLKHLEKHYGSPCARVLFCSVDPTVYYPEECEARWDLGYLGTYGSDRQPTLECLLTEPARQWEHGRFLVAGPMYPEEIAWPANVERVDHLPPTEHRTFYNSQRFTLNVTRADMVRAGYSPSVRLFEAAACATPIISDYWKGLDALFRPGKDILIARTPSESLSFLRDLSEERRQRIGENGRQRVLAQHTAAHRAVELEEYIDEVRRHPKLMSQHAPLRFARQTTPLV